MAASACWRNRAGYLSSARVLVFRAYARRAVASPPWPATSIPMCSRHCELTSSSTHRASAACGARGWATATARSVRALRAPAPILRQSAWFACRGGAAVEGSVAVRQLDWAAAADIAALLAEFGGGFDVVCGSDVVYEEGGIRSLLSVAAALLRHSPAARLL
eukprot:SAG11_NODE_9058_length_948_cov_1.276796_2_plen_161_part_01